MHLVQTKKLQGNNKRGLTHKKETNLTTATTSNVGYLEKITTNTLATHEKLFLEELPNNMLKHDVS